MFRTFILISLAHVSIRHCDAEDWDTDLQPFLDAHCVACHDVEAASGELSFADLGHDLSDAETMRRWVLVHDRMASGEMPPSSELQPDRDDLVSTVETLAGALNSADRARSDVVLRRLNRVEYENTVRDLFHTNVNVKDVLPRDSSADGFDNVGESLAMSAEAALTYLQAADIVLNAVFGSAKEPKRIHHVTNLLDQKTYDGKPALAKQYGRMFRKTDDGLVIFQSGYCPTNLVNFSRLRAPAGTYRGSLRVRAIQSEKPVVLRIYGGDTIVGRREKHLVGYFDVPPGDWSTIEFTDRLVESGGTYQPKCYGTKDTRKDADTYPEPGIEIGEITIEGPLEEWPPRSRIELLRGIDLETATASDAEEVLSRVVPLAFRRPATADEIKQFVQLATVAINAGRTFEESLRTSLKGVLCSPEFLFLDEPGRDRITQHAIANRLSYFLWSSMPDDRLRELADAGQLANPEVLRDQVERMLMDRRSAMFVENFVGQWLQLREIDFTNPDANLYPDFDELLKISMVAETEAFFRTILDEDLSLLNFVDSDFAMLNERLAKHYDIDGVKGQAIRRVDLPPDSPRGGVLTQASILKVTANGTTTSPVLRGAWVMENILGEAVPPPPSNVPAVEPDIRGAVTLREQLKKHSNSESCAVCHRRIDPAGFALENFDVIGGYREQYRTLGEGKRPSFGRDPNTFAWIRYRIGLPVDSTGLTANGQSFDGIRDYKRILLQHENEIAKGLTRKLMTYALGRRIGFSDREDIQNIAKDVSKKNYGLRQLVHAIVQSDIFARP